MTTTSQRVLVVLWALLISGLARGGPLVIGDGDTYVVLPDEKLATGDVVVNGTFRNQGVVTHSGLFENFGFTAPFVLFLSAAGSLFGLRRKSRCQSNRSSGQVS